MRHSASATSLFGSPGPAIAAGSAEAAGGLAQLLDEWSYGVVLATPEARVLHANHSAQQELARGGALTSVEGCLQAAAATHQKLLRQAITKAANGLRSLLMLPQRSGDAAAAAESGSLGMVTVPLRAEPGPPRVALLLARSRVCEPLMLCFFARSHGLTPMEEQVLGLLCQGRSAPEVARQLAVAVSTVRSHVRALCAKTQSSGVRAVVQRVAVLPPLGPSRLRDAMH